MKKTRKIISLLLSILMIITSVPLMALNSFAASSGDYEYDLLKDGTAQIKHYEGSETEIEIPSEIDGHRVTFIISGAFEGCTSLTSVTIPDSVTEIGWGAFSGCTSLTSVTIGSGVTRIDGCAFENCTSLTSITIPDSVTSIGSGVFSGCTSLMSITIPKSVTRIGECAFEDCTSLTSITIPDSVTRIGGGAFSGCTSLTSITIPESVTSIGRGVFENTAYYNNESNWENSLLYIGNHLIEAKEDVSGNIEIKQGTKNIADSAFQFCTLITSITIPNSVTEIGGYAFSGCTSLTSITIPDSVTEIGWDAFSGCTSLTSVKIGNGVTSIGSGAFFGCTSLKSVTIGNSVTTIGGSAFNGCTSLKSVTIGNSVTSIEGSAFNGCTSLKNVIIPDSVTYIGVSAFKDCTLLASVTIPDCEMIIDYDAFYNTAYYNNESNWESGLLYIDNHLIRAKEDISGNVSIKQGTKTIASEAFELCTSLTNVAIPNSVTGTVYRAFINCTSLASIAIPNSVTSISEVAFSGCTSLTNVTIGSGVIGIGDFAFKNCTSLTSITIPDGVKYIGNYTFSDCTSLTNVTIGNGVTSIGAWAFENCTSLMETVIPKSVTEIGYEAFGYYYDSIENKFKTNGFTIYGNKGSEAERYANENGFKFVAIGDAPTMTFPDVASGDWYYNAVKFNAEKGYVTGYSNGTFGPSNNIQRQDFVLILSRIAGANLSAYEGQNGGFSDVQAGAYYASAVAWAKDKGIVTGYSADNFGVGTYISREQISLILCRYLGGGTSGNVDAILNAYSDGGNTSPWAKAGVAWAVENGIIGNSDYLNPNGNAGRAEVAQIIYNMSNKGML
mgnify:CR=1 FL=1